MDICAIENMIHEYDLIIDEKRAKLEKIQNEIVKLCKERDVYADQIRNHNKNNLEYIMNDIGAFHQWCDLLPKQAYNNGYYHDEFGVMGKRPKNEERRRPQQAFEVMLNYKEEPSEELINFINNWLPLSVYKKIGIFRYDLHMDGHWWISFEDDMWRVNDDYRTEFEAVDLVEVLRYVAEFHYYEKDEHDE